MNNDKVKKFWDDVAVSSGHKDKRNSGMLGPGTKFFEDYRQVQEEKNFNDIVDIKKIKNVLEVGCGGGRWSFYLCDKVSFVTGIDISGEMIKLSESIRENRAVRNVKFIETDFLSFYDDVTYDLIYFSGVLQYIDDDTLKKMFKKINVILSAEGVVISRDTVQKVSRVEKSDGYPVIYRTLNEYEVLFKKGGYQVKENRVAYNIVRFSRIVDIFYCPPVLNMKFALFVGSILGRINKFLGSPKWLMSRGLREASSSENIQEHVFTKYIRDN